MGAEGAIASVPEDFGAGGSHKQMSGAKTLLPAGNGGWYLQYGVSLGSSVQICRVSICCWAKITAFLQHRG